MTALRLLATRGRLITGRPAIVVAAARARRGGRAYTLWPGADQPMIAADMGYPPAAEWLRRTVVPTLRRLPDAASWMTLRAGAVLVVERDGLAAQLGKSLLGAPPRIALFSPAGQAVSKVICFLFAEGDREPRLVVKAMAEPRFGTRLRDEYDVLAVVRERVAHASHVVAALPRAPQIADERFGEFIVVEPFDPLGAAAGLARREDAADWLYDFQSASRLRATSWGDDDERWALEHTSEAWRLAGLPSDAIVARLRGALTPLRGTTVPRCVVHGDFWRGNIAARDGAVRVFDWEWSRQDGTPFVDLWTYELAELRIAARAGAAALDEPLAEALTRVERELTRRGIDERLALATLPPVLGALAFRVRRRLRMPDEMERPSIRVMAAAARLLRER